MKNIILVCSICFMLFVNYTNAQVHESWEAIFNYTNHDDLPSSLAVDNAGIVYVTGKSISNITGTDYATIKYSPAGSPLWNVRYNGYGSGTDEAHSIAVDNSGNVYITGQSEGNGTGEDFATIKYNSSGVQQWVARYNGPGNFSEAANSIAIDNSGNILVAGYGVGYNFKCAFITIKYNSSGIVLWTKRYEFTPVALGGPIFVKTDNLGNAYIAGPKHIGSDLVNILMIKYNSAGTQQWSQTYARPEKIDGINHFAVDNSGNVYVTGISKDTGPNREMLTIKYSTSGNLLWLDRYGYPNGVGYSIAVDNMGNVIVGGGNNYDFVTIKYNSTGIKQWISKYNGPAGGIDAVWDLALDDSSNVYATGISTGIGSALDITTLKYNTFGVQQWRIRKTNPGNDYPATPNNGTAVDGNYNVYVLGEKMNSSGNVDYCTIKYSQQTRLSKGSGVSEIPDKFSLSQNFPNPFNPVTRISFDLPGESNTLLAVYDALGNQVSILVNEKLQPGTYSAEWDASGFSSGVYFYKLITEGYTETRKMILLK